MVPASLLRAKPGLPRQDMAEEWSARARFPEPGVVCDLIDMVPAFIHVSVIEPIEAKYFRHCMCLPPRSPGAVPHNVGTQQRARAGGSISAARARCCASAIGATALLPSSNQQT